MTDEQQELIDEILAKFDFNKVHKLMRILGWERFGVGIPSAKEIKKTATGLLTDACSDESAELQLAKTGGLLALRMGNELHLIFEAESCYRRS